MPSIENIQYINSASIGYATITNVTSSKITSTQITSSGGLFGTASWAQSSSYALTASLLLGSVSSATFAVSASWASSSISSSYAPGSPSVSASYALSASYAPSSPSVSASYATTASYLLGDNILGQTEIDFGTIPVSNGTFTASLSGVTTNSIVMAQTAWVAPTGKDIDELEMDFLEIICQPNTNYFSMYIESRDGSYLADKFKINYTAKI